jgi:predicted ATPase
MELLERDTFLADLDRLLADAAAGRGRLVFVGGEAGVGKTAFVGRVAESARKTARVLVGACDPMSTPRPLAPVLDIAATAPRRLDQQGVGPGSLLLRLGSRGARPRASDHRGLPRATSPRTVDPSCLTGGWRTPSETRDYGGPTAPPPRR